MSVRRRPVQGASPWMWRENVFRAWGGSGSLLLGVVARLDAGGEVVFDDNFIRLLAVFVGAVDAAVRLDANGAFRPARFGPIELPLLPLRWGVRSEVASRPAAHGRVERGGAASTHRRKGRARGGAGRPEGCPPGSPR